MQVRVNFAVEKALENILPTLLDKVIKSTIAESVAAPILEGFASHKVQMKEGFIHHEREIQKLFKWVKQFFEVVQTKLETDVSEGEPSNVHRRQRK